MMNLADTLGAIAILVAFMVPYLYDRLEIGTKIAKGNRNRATKRISKLNNDLAIAKKYSSNRPHLNGYLISRLTLAVVVWFALQVVLSLWQLLAYGSNNLESFTNPSAFSQPDFGSTSAKISFTLGTVISLLGLLLTMWSFRIAYRAYSLWRRVENIDGFEASVKEQEDELQTSLPADSAA
jgi:hypothetical protein